MALMKGEGTHQILYGGADIFSGLRHNRGYLARPDHSGSFPALLLIHGADGLSSSVKSVARRLARNGLAVVGPDLYRGGRTLHTPPPPWPGTARVAADVSDAFQWMASADTAWLRPGPIGIVAFDRAAEAAVGFGEGQNGGALALISPVFENAIPATRIPVLGFYGKEDEVVSSEMRQAAQQHLSHGEWVLYGSAGHGLVDESAADYRWEVAEDVIDRMVAFFGAGRT